MNQINFTANYIKQVQIAKRAAGTYRPYTASLVEMDCNNPQDIKAISATALKWEDSLTAFVSSDMRKSKLDPAQEPFHVYAITRQKNNFDNMNSKCILGVVHVSENADKKGHKIEVLQTNPDYMYFKNTTAQRDFKNIGKELISYVKETFNDKPIHLYPTKDAVEFYEKQGFQTVESNLMVLI